jgi:ribosomal protein S2
MKLNSNIILKNYIKKVYENFDLVVYNFLQEEKVDLIKISSIMKRLNINSHFIDFFHVFSYLIICFYHIKKILKLNKKILFISINENDNISKLLLYYSKYCKELYVNSRWKAGSLTNINIGLEQIKKLKILKKKKLNHKISFKETILLEKKIRKLESYYSGLIELKSIPGLIFNFNQKHQKTINYECNKLKIPIINVLENFSIKQEKRNISILINRYHLKKLDFFLKQISSFINHLKIEKNYNSLK